MAAHIDISMTMAAQWTAQCVKSFILQSMSLLREEGGREKSSLCFAILLLARILLTTTMAVTGQTMTGVQCTLTLHTPVSRGQVTTGEAR